MQAALATMAEAAARQGQVIWRPSSAQVERSNLLRFMRGLNAAHGTVLHDYDSLHAFSLAEPARFWGAAWDFCGVIGERGTAPALQCGTTMMEARWFEGAQLNFAENLLRVRDERIVISAWDETGHRRSITGAALRAEVSRVMQALAAEGVGPGDCVAGYLPNVAETLIAMLAATALGAAWSVCSPELGAPAVINRFSQIQPKVLFTASGVRYAGKFFDTRDKAAEVAAALSAKQVEVACDGAPGTGAPWDQWLAPFAPQEICFERFPFDHPCYILYTSGTTGKPKCIVHGAGGTLIKHLVDQVLQNDVRPGDRIFRVTTSGWMLWNALASALGAEATAILYEGSPFHPRVTVLLDILERERVTMWGVAPSVLERYEQEGLVPRESHDLAALRTVVAGGMRLGPGSYVWAYRNLKEDMALASPSGGTDIISFFVGGNPIGPCRVGEIQVRALGIALAIYDETGTPVVGTPGEMVCTQPFPSMPVGFWGDADRSRYRAAYFERFPGVWTHGDWAQITPHGSVIIHGRSDSTLKLRGVRVGTAEIYDQVGSFAEVAEAAAVEQSLAQGSRVVLFVVLRSGPLLEDLAARIRRRIAERASPRHVPDLIVEAPELPRTSTGKVSELAIRDAISGRPVKGEQSLVNPSSLKYFRTFGGGAVAADEPASALS